MLNAGGAYGAVCTMVEALPVAARLNELGVDCFCLNYTVVSKKSFLQGLMPKPLTDLADAWTFIHSHATDFGLDASKYYVGGFSAGGHLSAAWGTKNTGARSYNIPQPKGLMLVYPLISVESVSDNNVKRFMKTGMYGAGKASKLGPEYEIHKHVDGLYPPTYIIQSLDDDSVPVNNITLMENALKAAGVPHLAEPVKCGGHGFGLGTIAPGSAWVERALAFLAEERNNGSDDEI